MNIGVERGKTGIIFFSCRHRTPMLMKKKLFIKKLKPAS